MATLDADSEEIVRVKFHRDTIYGRFQDALYFTVSDFDLLTDQQVNQQKNARRDAWIAAIEAQLNAPPPTKQQLKDEKDGLLEQKAVIQARIDELTILIASM